MSYSDYFPTVAWLSRRWKRVSVYIAITFVAVAISPVVALHVDESILRSRAERLQRDLEKVVVGRTTLAEARAISQGWGSGSESVERRIDGANTMFVTYLNGSLALRLQALLVRSGQVTERQFTQGCLLTHVHLSLISAWISVSGGVVTEKGFSVFVIAPSVTEVEKWLGGWVRTGPELRIDQDEQLEFPMKELQIHPEYVVGHNKGPTFVPGYNIESEVIWLKFALGASPGDLGRLAQFNLDCLTRWSPCRTAADLMPEAWKQFKQDLGSSKETPPGFRSQ